MDTLTSEIKCLALATADLVGIAPVERLAGAPVGHRLENVLHGAQSVIVVGSQCIHALVDNLPSSRPLYSRYMTIMGQDCDRLTYQISVFLQKQGYRAYPVPNSEPYDLTKLAGVISLKHAAVAAGLGQFGLNNLVITPQYGPRLRFGAVITDAKLAPDALYEDNLCSQTRHLCRMACIKNCPAQALPGQGQPDPLVGSSGMAMDKTACFHYQEFSLGKSGRDGLPNRCGLCIFNCPIGRPAISSSS